MPTVDRGEQEGIVITFEGFVMQKRKAPLIHGVRVRCWPENRDTGATVSTNPIILPFLSRSGFRTSFPAVMNECRASFAFAS